MKRAAWMAMWLAVGLAASAVYAGIRDSDLRKKVVITEEAALLQQVDTVSLYLSSERAALAPRLAGGIIEVETTLLASDLIISPSKGREYVARLAETFLAVLKERLPIYVPDIATRFDPAADITFVVNAGAERRFLGAYKGGAWIEGEGAMALPALSEGPLALPTAAKGLSGAKAVEARAKPVISPKGCACPARR